MGCNLLVFGPKGLKGHRKRKRVRERDCIGGYLFVFSVICFCFVCMTRKLEKKQKDEEENNSINLMLLSSTFLVKLNGF